MDDGKNNIDNDFLDLEFDAHSLLFFLLKLRIFVMIENINDVSYFVLEMFMMMGSTSDV